MTNLSLHSHREKNGHFVKSLEYLSSSVTNFKLFCNRVRIQNNSVKTCPYILSSWQCRIVFTALTRTFYIRRSLVVARTLVELYEKQSSSLFSHFVPEILACVLLNIVFFYFSSFEAGIANAIPSFWWRNIILLRDLQNSYISSIYHPSQTNYQIHWHRIWPETCLRPYIYIYNYMHLAGQGITFLLDDYCIQIIPDM